jgi:hypothetical protein
MVKYVWNELSYSLINYITSICIPEISYGECYNIGYGNEYVDGQNGYSSINAFYYHTEVYCKEYYQGYRDTFSNNANTGFQV